MRTSKQMSLKLPHRGGKRTGAGRKPKGPRALVSHKARPRFEKPAAVHVTLRVATHVWNLRSRRCFRVIEGCFADARGQSGLRIVEFAVMGNHMHLLAEAESDVALSRGMQGLTVRISRRLNRLMDGRGTVFADHYHARVLSSPSELVSAIGYLLGNAAHHYGIERADGFCSSALDAEERERVLSRPQTWLLKSGWRRAKRIPLSLEKLWACQASDKAPSDRPQTGTNRMIAPREVTDLLRGSALSHL